jgi:hypothetical protein
MIGAHAMPMIDDEPEESDVPALAVQALKEAQKQTALRGLPVVVVRHGQLVRYSDGKTTILKRLPARKKVKTGTVAAPS